MSFGSCFVILDSEFLILDSRTITLPDMAVLVKHEH